MPPNGEIENMVGTYSFDVNFVNPKLPSFSATCSICHNNMPDGQNKRADEQSYLGGSQIPASLLRARKRSTKHKRGLERNKDEGQKRAHGGDPQIGPM